MSRITLVVISLIVMLVAGIGYVSKQKHDSVLKSTSEGLILGNTYGKMIEQSSCIVGLRLKYGSCSATECELSANGYISGCMKTAKQDQFCSSVPNIRDTKNAVSWVSKTCSEYGFAEDRCSKYMHKLISACTEQIESRTIPQSEVFERGFQKGLRRGSE